MNEGLQTIKCTLLCSAIHSQSVTGSLMSKHVTSVNSTRGEGVVPYQSGGGVPPEPHGEREIKKCMVTKRELLNNLSNIYKCKVSPGGTFSLGNFLFDERENYQV